MSALGQRPVADCAEKQGSRQHGRRLPSRCHRLPCIHTAWWKVGRSATIPMLGSFVLVVALSRAMVPFAGFVMALMRSIAPAVTLVPVVLAVIRLRARDLGTVPQVAARVIAGLGQRRKAEKSHECAENNGLPHCLLQCPVLAGYSARTPRTMRSGR